MRLLFAGLFTLLLAVTLSAETIWTEVRYRQGDMQASNFPITCDSVMVRTTTVRYFVYVFDTLGAVDTIRMDTLSVTADTTLWCPK